MGLCDLLLGNRFEVRVSEVKLGQHLLVEPPITSLLSYVAYKCGEKSQGYVCYEVGINASVVPLDKPFLSFEVDIMYKSDKVRSDPVSVHNEWLRLKKEIEDINQLIQKESLVLQTRVRAEVPPAIVTPDSQYAEDFSEKLPRDLYHRIAGHA